MKPPCTIADCAAPQVARGWCRVHYNRFHRWGSPHVLKKVASYGFGKSAHEIPEYKSWQAMKNRCLNPNYREYKHYGGRGIKVSDLWVNDFPRFLEDMGLRPSLKHSLDRIDVNGDYEPGNCRWADVYTQAQNQRRRIDNKSGIKGVSRQGKRWKVTTMRHGFFVGTHVDSLGDARVAKEKLDAVLDIVEDEMSKPFAIDAYMGKKVIEDGKPF